MTDDIEIRWGLAQRFEFIEWRTYWEGRINRRDLEQMFQVSSPQASSDLQRYLEATKEVAGHAVRENIRYDATEKTYLATPDFRPKYLDLSADNYLSQLHAITTGAIRKADTWFEQVPPADVSPTLSRGPHAFTLRAILRAMEKHDAISINYRSLTSTGMRTIWPHAFAHDGFRWHVRALCLEKLEYRDYVLGRILSIGEQKPCDANAADDLEWQTKFDLELVAHPGLDLEQKSTIEHDYRLKNGKLIVKLRLALAYYFIKRYNLDLRGAQIEPARAQLFLQNFDEFNAASVDTKLGSKVLVAKRHSARNS